jgi:hypothetical protein
MTTKKKTASKKTSEKKFTLVELVAGSDLHYPLIIMNLSRAGLLEQYENEKEAYGTLDIEPTITEAEFNKIMEA